MRPVRYPDGADRRAMSFLRRGAIERRPSGWRFGTARIPDVVIERIVAAGKARRTADRVELSGRPR